MFVNQLSIFIENKAGRLDEVLEILKQENINMISISLADTNDYGLLRLLVSEPEKGREALKANGFSAMLTPVLAVKLSHEVGALQELLATVCKAGINIEYTYGLSTSTGEAAIAIKTSDLDETRALVEKMQIPCFTNEDLKKM